MRQSKPSKVPKVKDSLQTSDRGKGVKPAGKRQHPEHWEQVTLFQWAGVASGHYPELRLLYAVPNGAPGSPRMGAWLKAEGKRAGVPDVVLPVARAGYHSLYLEMKVPGNDTTPEQRAWIHALRQAGNKVHICFSFDDAKTAVENYLRGVDNAVHN